MTVPRAQRRALAAVVLSCSVAVALAGSLAAPATAAPSLPSAYRVVDLGPAAPGTAPVGVTLKGAVALTIPGDDGPHAAVWSSGRQGLRDLGPGTAVAINERGQVAGVVEGTAVRWEPDGSLTRLGGPDATVVGISSDGTVAGSLAGEVALWRADGPEVVQSLPAAPLWAASRATGINARGDVVGVWTPLTMSPLPPTTCYLFRLQAGGDPQAWPRTSVPVPCDETARGSVGIADTGWTAGNELTEDGPGVWVADPNGRVRHLGTQGGLGASAVAVAGAGIVALEYLGRDDDVDAAAAWTPRDGLIPLNVAEQHWGYAGAATAVSASGLVAGWTVSGTPSAQGAFAWDAAGGFRHLPGLVEPAPVKSDDVPVPAAVNRRGWVVGTASAPDGTRHAVLWRP